MSRTSERLLTKASGTRGTGRWPVLPHGRVQRPDREAFLRRACHPRGLAAARNPGERKQMQTGVMLCECGTYRGPSPTAAESVLTRWREQRSCPRGNPGVVTRNASRVWGQLRPPRPCGRDGDVKTSRPLELICLSHTAGLGVWGS